MPAIKSVYSRWLEQLLADRKAELLDSMANGVPADYPAYRQLVGHIEGLKDALKIAEEVDFKISGEEPNARS